MAMTLTSSSRTITLPKYAPGGLSVMNPQNIAKTVSLSGKLSVDVLSVRSGYKITFDVITEAEFQQIKQIRDDQINNNEFLEFNDPDLGRTDWVVWLTIPEERDLRWNKQAVQGLTIMVEARDADS